MPAAEQTFLPRAIPWRLEAAPTQMPTAPRARMVCGAKRVRSLYLPPMPGVTPKLPTTTPPEGLASLSTINGATMRLCRADLPASARSSRLKSCSHLKSAGTGGRDGLRRKALPEPLPSSDARSDPQAFHHNPARRPGLALHYQWRDYAPLQSRPPCPAPYRIAAGGSCIMRARPPRI